jgi:hypothetical protein
MKNQMSDIDSTYVYEPLKYHVRAHPGDGTMLNHCTIDEIASLELEWLGNDNILLVETHLVLPTCYHCKQ